MNRSSNRVQLTRAFVLHQRPFRDSSLIVEVFAREHGRLTVFAHAARRTRTRFAALQPFRALLLSWSGRGEAPQLTGAEHGGASYLLPAARLMSAFYLNELLIKLLTRHDPHPELFDCYEATLQQLSQQDQADGPLRHFEARLLDFIGYGLNLAAEADTGQPVRADAYYQFRPGVHGFVVAEPSCSGSIQGEVLRRLASGVEMKGEGELRQARSLMRAALDHCLEGRELSTRAVARSLRHYPRKERIG
jgi:DNA repair protein RecO (recombination protein O)